MYCEWGGVSGNERRRRQVARVPARIFQEVLNEVLLGRIRDSALHKHTAGTSSGRKSAGTDWSAAAEKVQAPYALPCEQGFHWAETESHNG